MKHLFKLSLLLLALLLPATALAHDFEVDGIYYKINGNEATVTYRGTSSSQYSNEYTGDVTIPSSVTFNGTTYFVTSIGSDAFSHCSGLTRITIPNSVTYIGESAFYFCSGLTSVTIGNSVTFIGESAFSGCSLTSIVVASGNPTYDSRSNCNAIIETSTHTLITGCMNTVIPNNVTAIGSSAFSSCYGLTSITIPNSVTSISYGAFSDCIGLTSITVASGNSTYDSRGNCNAIIESATNSLVVGCKNTVIPNSVTTIDDLAFSGCRGLTSIEIPNSVTSIGSQAFNGCSLLDSITIPNSVTSIGNGAFSWCESLTSIDIPNSVLHIGSDIFGLCWNLTSVTIGNSITTISDGAFFQCVSLTSVSIGNSVITIGNSAFRECMFLSSITIPNSVTAIGSSAFEGCGLTNIDLGNSVISIGDDAFAYCYDLTEIYSLALTPPTVYSHTFNGCYGATLYVPENALDNYKSADYWNEFSNIDCITFDADSIYYRVMDASTVSLMANNDEGILYKGDVVIPDSVTYEGYTFAVKGIEDNAFDGCFELTSITIPNSVETIGEQAFQGCTGLTNVTIGSGVTAIGAKAFNYCNTLETVKCLGLVPPVMASTNCFTTTAYNRVQLLVPRNSEAAYAAADYWYKFAHIDGWGSAGQGDVNGDGAMSITDVTALIDVLLGNELDSFYFDSADLNSNGRLDIGDVTTLIDNLLNGDY